MKIRIICVGKIKEKFYRDAVDEYIKRLGRYAKIEIDEAADEKTPEDAGEKVREQILHKEGERILAKIRDTDYVCALAIDGRELSSPDFAGHISGLMGGGKSTVDLVIGGSLGLSGEVLARADEKISFSRMTFPHQLMRVILLEQIYRAFRIINHEPYHK